MNEELIVGTFMGAYFIVAALFSLFMIITTWIIFQKAGKPGWACLIPIYSTIVMLEIVDRPIWWIVLYFVPIANLIIGIIVTFDLAKAFGKDIGYGFGLLFLPLIFMPILAFGDAQHVGVERF
jgi:hypothetical protein